jgi:hypothetical protein
MYNDVVAGHTENALRTLNDPRWDSIVGGQRPKLEEAIRKFSNERIQDQDRLDKHQQNLDAISRDKDIGDLYTNSLLPKTDPKYVADPLDAINKKYQGDDLINARKEFNQLVTGPTQHQTDISKATFSDLASRVNLPYGDPNKITNLDEIRQARQKAPGTPGSLSRADSNELTNMITRQSTPEGDRLNTDTEKFLDSRKGFISKSNPLMGKLDPSGDAQVYDYRMAIRDKQQQLLQRGDDPRKAITPGNPDYMGSPENMQRFQTPISQSVKNLSDRLRQGQPGTQPGGTQTQQPTGPPSGTPAAKIPGVLRSPSTGMYQDPKTKQIYGTDGYPQKMNFSPEGGGSEGQNAINNAMGVDAHNDKNFFSSGRAEQAGIDGGIGENLKTITTQGQTVQVNAAAAPHFQGFLDELERKGYKVDDIGGYSNRMKRGSFTSMSEHAFGNAIDINPDKNPFHSAKDNLPKDVAQIAARYGLIWGGDWNGRSRDPMHFEWSGKGGSSVTASR